MAPACRRGRANTSSVVIPPSRVVVLPPSSAYRRCGRRPDVALGSGALNRVVVLHDGERVVEPVEQPAPLLILGRAAEAVRVVFQSFPLDQQQVRPRALSTAREPETQEARH